MAHRSKEQALIDARKMQSDAQTKKASNLEAF